VKTFKSCCCYICIETRQEAKKREAEKNGMNEQSNILRTFFAIATMLPCMTIKYELAPFPSNLRANVASKKERKNK
jgi:hypothetical protein